MLKEKLAEIAAQTVKKLTPELIAVVKQTTWAVADSIPSRAIPKVGGSAPEFKLPDSKGNEHSSADLIGSGHLVVSFFRGSW